MTALKRDPPKTPETLMRDHIVAMRSYASEIEKTLGEESPIVKRIRSCASSNEIQLDRVAPKRCQACGQDRPA